VERQVFAQLVLVMVEWGVEEVLGRQKLDGQGLGQVALHLGWGEQGRQWGGLQWGFVLQESKG